MFIKVRPREMQVIRKAIDRAVESGVFHYIRRVERKMNRFNWTAKIPS